MNDTGTLQMLEADPSRSLAVFLSDYTFSCDGIVKQWRVRWNFMDIKMCKIIFDFYVLRLSSKDDSYCGVTSVGMNRFILQSDQDNDGLSPEEGVFNVPRVDGIEVMVGDWVGVTVTFNDTMGCSAGARLTIMESIDADSQSVMYYSRQQQSPGVSADFNDDFQLVSGFGCDSYDTNTSQDETSKTRTRTRHTSEDDEDDEETSKTRTKTRHTSEDDDEDEETSNTTRTKTHRPRPGTPRPGTPRPGTPTSDILMPDTPMHDESKVGVYIGAPLITVIVGKSHTTTVSL